MHPDASGLGYASVAICIPAEGNRQRTNAVKINEESTIRRGACNMVTASRIAYPRGGFEKPLHFSGRRTAVNHRRIANTLGTLLACCGLAAAVGAAESAPSAAPAAAATAAHGSTNPGWELFQTYCNECHNAEDWAGGVAFDTMTETDIPQNIEVLEKVVRKMRSQQMPPGGEKVPDKATRAAFVSWMEGNLDEAGARASRSGPRRPAPAEPQGIRQRSARPAQPRDRSGGAAAARRTRARASTTSPSALQVTPSFLDQYIAAARIVAVQALGNKDALPAGTTYRAQKPSSQLFHQDGLPLGTRGGIAVDHNFPADGEYVLNIANMAQALWVYNMEFENQLVVTLDGELIYETTIGGETDMKAIDQKQDPAVDAINERLKNIRFNAKAGVHRFVVAFRHRTFAESEDRLQMYVPGGGQDRVLRVSSFEIRGPFNADRREPDGEPQAHLHLLSAERRRRNGPAPSR